MPVLKSWYLNTIEKFCLGMYWGINLYTVWTVAGKYAYVEC